jgi:Zinc-finger of RNA-polymerase I-specific TFIIB, Rrn7
MDDVSLGHDDACELCGSRQFHVEDGHTFCDNGHQQEGVDIGEDEADYGTQGKRVRKKEAKSKVKISKGAPFSQCHIELRAHL